MHKEGGEKKKGSLDNLVCAWKNMGGTPFLVRNNKKHIHRGVVQPHEWGAKWLVGADSADHQPFDPIVALLLFISLLLYATLLSFQTHNASGHIST